MRCSTSDPVGANHLDDGRQRSGIITVRRERSRGKLVVGTDADIDAALPVSLTDAGNLEAVDLAQPHAVVGDNVKTSFREQRTELDAIGRAIDRRWLNGNWLKCAVNGTPQAWNRIAEALGGSSQGRVGIIKNQIDRFASLRSGPDQRSPQNPAGGVREVRPSLIVDAYRRATAEA